MRPPTSLTAADFNDRTLNRADNCWHRARWLKPTRVGSVCEGPEGDLRHDVRVDITALLASKAVRFPGREEDGATCRARSSRYVAARDRMRVESLELVEVLVRRPVGWNRQDEERSVDRVVHASERRGRGVALALAHELQVQRRELEAGAVPPVDAERSLVDGRNGPVPRDRRAALPRMELESASFVSEHVLTLSRAGLHDKTYSVQDSTMAVARGNSATRAPGSKPGGFGSCARVMPARRRPRSMVPFLLAARPGAL